MDRRDFIKKTVFTAGAVAFAPAVFASLPGIVYINQRQGPTTIFKHRKWLYSASPHVWDEVLTMQNNINVHYGKYTMDLSGEKLNGNG